MRVQHIEDYYTLQGAAEALDRSYWQVWRVIHQQQIPTLLLGQTALVRLADLRAAFPAQPAAPATTPTGTEAGGTSPHTAPLAAPPALAAPSLPASNYRVRGHLCPECGSNSLVYEEGCQKCYACGYSVC